MAKQVLFPRQIRSEIPFNISLLQLHPQNLQGLKPVRVLDIFDGASGNFHEDGLFSTSIFGRVGDERRNKRFSYIDIKITIFHPLIFRALSSLKRLYAGIVAGTEYVLWNPEVKDFEKSNPIEGHTGFQYFLNHWKMIEFQDTKSVSREELIKLVENARKSDTGMTDKVIVAPAGLRDLEVEDDGRMKEDEINTIYRKILSISNTISEASIKKNPELANTARYNLQLAFNSLYDYIERMLEGKKKMIQGKWGSRRIYNGTRNVITAMDTSTPYLGAPGSVKFNNTVIGMYQMMKCVMPVARFHIRNGFLGEVFQAIDAPVVLVNKKTLKREEVRLRSEYYDRWASDEGLEKVITSFWDLSLRHKPLELDGRYIGLIYKGRDGSFRLMHSIDELPEGKDPADVSPITFAELLYCSLYRELNKYPLFVTRYPVAGVGSIYPSFAFVKTTIKAETRKELNELWEPKGDDFVAHEFPIRDSAFMDSLVPHSSRLAGLVADFDGDTSSANGVYSREAVAEIMHYLKTRRAYVGVDGKFVASCDIVTTALVLHNMTGD